MTAYDGPKLSRRDRKLLARPYEVWGAHWWERTGFSKAEAEALYQIRENGHRNGKVREDLLRQADDMRTKLVRTVERIDRRALGRGDGRGHG